MIAVCQGRNRAFVLGPGDEISVSDQSVLLKNDFGRDIKRQRVLGVYDSEERAAEAFHEAIGKAPSKGGLIVFPEE